MLLHGLDPEREERLREEEKPCLEQFAEVRKKLATASGEEKEKLQAQLSLLTVTYRTILSKYFQEQEEEDFAQIKGGAKGIIRHAKKLLPLIMEKATDILDASEYGGVIVHNQGTEAEEIRIKASYVHDMIMYNLRLHINALRDNDEALQDLFLLITKSIKESTIIEEDREGEATPESLQADPQALDTFRRMPLANIKEVGIMADKTNRIIVEEPGGMLDALLQQEANGQLAFKVNQGTKGKEVLVMFSMTIPQEYGSLSRKITGFDIGVYNAVANLFENWIFANGETPFLFTAAEVWRRMNGKQPNDSKTKPSPEKEKRICDSIEKMRHTDFYMDITQEQEAGFKPEDSRLAQGRFTTLLLKCDIIEKFTNERKVEMKGYIMHPHDLPILYAYNKARGHVRYIPYELLDTSDILSDSEYVTEFKYYLLQQILYLKSQEEKALTDKSKKPKRRINPDNIITLERIYKGAGVPPPEERNEKKLRDERAKDRKKIEGILTSFTQKKWIAGYIAVNVDNEQAKERQAVKGYSIKL